MTDKELLELAADMYRRDGYAVTYHPVAGDLPAVLADAGIDLVARRGQESVAVFVRRREDLLNLDPAHGSSDPAPGWHLELVVVPPSADPASANGRAKANRVRRDAERTTR